MVRLRSEGCLPMHYQQQGSSRKPISSKQLCIIFKSVIFRSCIFHARDFFGASLSGPACSGDPRNPESQNDIYPHINTKGSARQRCMFEGQLQTKSKLTDPSNWHWVWYNHTRQMALPSCMAAAIRVAECEYFEGGTQVWCFLECSGGETKFKLVKTTFNAESFIRRLSQSISGDFDAVRSWNVRHSQKIHKNLYFGIQGHPRSLLSMPIKRQYKTSY